MPATRARPARQAWRPPAARPGAGRIAARRGRRMARPRVGRGAPARWSRSWRAPDALQCDALLLDGRRRPRSRSTRYKRRPAARRHSRPRCVPLLSGTLFALAAGLMWGLVFVAPAAAARLPGGVLSFGRYLAFGLIALPIAWLDRARLRAADARRLARGAQARRWSATSSTTCAWPAAIQRAGGPLPTMIIGTLPVVIAVSVQPARRAARRPAAVAPAGAVAGADRGRHRAASTTSSCDSCAPTRQPTSAATRSARCSRVGRGRLLDLVSDAQCRLAARTTPTAARAAGPPRRAWRRCRSALLGYAALLGAGTRRTGAAVRDAVRPAAGAVPRADVRDRPVRVVARHPVLERSQPAPADHAGRRS